MVRLRRRLNAALYYDSMLDDKLRGVKKEGRKMKDDGLDKFIVSTFVPFFLAICH